VDARSPADSWTPLLAATGLRVSPMKAISAKNSGHIFEQVKMTHVLDKKTDSPQFASEFHIKFLKLHFLALLWLQRPLSVAHDAL